MESQLALRSSLRLLGMALMLSVVPSIGVAKDKAPSDLSGTWKLNEEKSESLQEKLEQMGPPPMMGGGPMGGGPPMGGGMGPPRGGRGGRGPEGEMDPMRDPIMGTLAHPPMLMVIEQSDAKLVVSERGRTLRTLLLRDEGSDRDDRGLEQMRAEWKKGRIEAKGESSDGRKLRESYRLSKDGQSLTVVTAGQGPGGRFIELEKVYDRSKGESE